MRQKVKGLALRNEALGEVSRGNREGEFVSFNLGFQIVQTRGELIGNFTCARRKGKLRDSLFAGHISSFISVR